MPIYVSDDIVLKDNTISTAQSNADVQIVPNGSGSLAIDTVSITGNTIKTNSSNANLELDLSERPIKSAPVITIPEREAPGNSAKI